MKYSQRQVNKKHRVKIAKAKAKVSAAKTAEKK
jgi:hypothetical protein